MIKLWIRRLFQPSGGSCHYCLFGNSAHILPSSCFLVTICSLSQITCRFLEVGMYLVCEPFNTHHPGLRVVGCKLVLFLQVCWCVLMLTRHTRQSRVMNLISWRWGVSVCVCVQLVTFFFVTYQPCKKSSPMNDNTTVQDTCGRETQASRT